jgi:hypothetical protein
MTTPGHNYRLGDLRAHPAGMRIAFGGSDHEILQHAFQSYIGAQDAIAELVAKKLEILQHYDPPGMEDAVSICFWARSGSWLLQSYLDSHEDLVMLPKSRQLYPFLFEFESLSLWEKLVAYPTYCELRLGPDCLLLGGNTTVAPADYYAAVQALFAVYAERPAPWLNARKRFMQFLHVAYAVALGRCPGNSRPLIVYGQHWPNDELAQYFIADFPNGRFVHTIRDPISAFDSFYDFEVGVTTSHLNEVQEGVGPHPISLHYYDPAGQTVRFLLRCDGVLRGMEARTRAVRFEDLHLAPNATMKRLAEWLGIPFRPCMLQSTFNGVPFVWTSRGVSWVGANPDNARRRSNNLNAADRCMIYALLYDDFMAWNYPCPEALHRRWVRLCIIALLWLVPMKMELLNAQLIMKGQVLPALRRGRIGFACGAPAYLFMRRLVMMVFVATQTWKRMRGKRQVLKPL